MITQPDLPMTQPRETDHNVEMFVHYLRRQLTWVTAQQVCEALGLSTGEAGKRMVRAWAHADPNVISGNSGYRHADLASIDDVSEFLGRIQSQRIAMTNREIRVRRILHSKIQHASAI